MESVTLPSKGSVACRRVGNARFWATLLGQVNQSCHQGRSGCLRSLLSGGANGPQQNKSPSLALHIGAVPEFLGPTAVVIVVTPNLGPQKPEKSPWGAPPNTFSGHQVPLIEQSKRRTERGWGPETTTGESRPSSSIQKSGLDHKGNK